MLPERDGRLDGNRCMGAGGMTFDRRPPNLQLTEEAYI